MVEQSNTLILENVSICLSVDDLLEFALPNTRLTMLVADGGQNFTRVISIQKPDPILAVPRDEIISEGTNEEAMKLASELGCLYNLRELLER